MPRRVGFAVIFSIFRPSLPLWTFLPPHLYHPRDDCSQLTYCGHVVLSSAANTEFFKSTQLCDWQLECGTSWNSSKPFKEVDEFDSQRSRVWLCRQCYVYRRSHRNSRLVTSMSLLRRGRNFSNGSRRPIQKNKLCRQPVAMGRDSRLVTSLALPTAIGSGGGRRRRRRQQQSAPTVQERQQPTDRCCSQPRPPRPPSRCAAEHKTPGRGKLVSRW